MTDSIVLASEKEAAAIAASNLASSTTPKEKEPLENGEIKPAEGEEPEPEEIEDPEDPAEEVKEDEEGAVKAKEDEPKPKKKGGFQKKIERLNTRLTAAEQNAEYWRTQALREKPAEQKKVETIQDLSKRPKADDFKTADEYQEALTDWKVEQRLATERQKQQDDAVKKEIQAKFSQHGQRVEEFKKEHEDFEDDWKDAVSKVGENNLSLTVREVIVTSEMGPELMQELANDPKEFKRICGLSALEAAKALGKIEVRLTKPTTPKKEETKTKASPKPPTPVRTKGSNTSKGYHDKMTQREYEDWRNEQLKARGAR